MKSSSGYSQYSGYAQQGYGGYQQSYGQSSTYGTQPAYGSYNQSGYDHYSAPSTSRVAEPAGRALTKSAPNQSVIFIGLPPAVGDDGLMAFLEDMGASVDSATVICDRETGLSKRFGFVRFASIEHARAFVEPNFPSVKWRDRYPSGDSTFDGIRVKIDYSQTDKVGGKNVRREGVPDYDTSVNDGSRDVASTPNSFLLLRQLDSLTTEQQIAAALNKTYEGKKFSGGIKRVLLIKDRMSSQSWSFAFVEFQHVNAAVAGLQHLLDPKLHPEGFRVDCAIPMASFAQSESFRPTYTASQWSVKASDEKTELMYWDSNAFPVVCEIQPAEPAGTSNMEPAPVAEKSESKKRKEPPSTSSTSQKISIPEVGMISVDLKALEKKKQADPIVAKKNHAFISQWDKRKEDQNAIPAAEPSYSAPADEFPFGDSIKFQCLLCQRQFKGVEELRRHTNKSDLHKTNLADAEKREAATERKAAVDAAQYRDRAAERRIALNQPDKPVLENPNRSHSKRAKYEPGPPPPAPLIQPNNNGITEDNRGHKLLQAAGWNKGEGLGNGKGRIAPIEVKMYSAGAGIGATAGEVVGGSNQPANRSELGRDKARSRFNA